MGLNLAVKLEGLIQAEPGVLLQGVTVTPDSTEVIAYSFDEAFNVTNAKGATQPDGEGGYAVGASFLNTDLPDVLINTGSTSSATWTSSTGSSTGLSTTLASARMFVGNAMNVATAVDITGDVTPDNAGVMTIQPGAVTGAKVSDALDAFGVAKTAFVLYDFATDGGLVGDISIASAAAIPDKAVVWIESYRVLTTLTSLTDAATAALTLPTDGALSTAIAISDGANPWDAGVFSRIAGALATPLTKLTSDVRTPTLTVAGEALLSGKILFELRYYVSE